jgi:hypothetical protein
MKDFQKIDWKLYNRPPFYQQWLCEEDTLKLATFGDRGLAEVDDQVLALKDQWDLENVRGHFLDRIGKLLSERRNGNTDEFYRILLKLRRLLNTNDGSIPSIIKAIKFFYSSEIVHIVPDYPAGLIIEHDGEGTPGLNFNKLLVEIIPAGVSFSTKELFYFKEELPSNEIMSKIRTVASMMDYMGYIFHNGVYRRNGQIRRQYNGVKDVLGIAIEYALRDQLFGRVMHNGLFRRDGTITHKSFVNDVATETLSFNGMINYLDNFPTSEKTVVISFLQGISDTAFIYDLLSASLIIALQDSASINEDTTAKINLSLKEPVSSDEKTVVTMARKIYDTPHKGIFRNGLIRRNGKYNRAENVVDVQKIKVHVSPIDPLNGSESMTIGYRKHYRHNGRFRRDGTVKHDSNVLFPLEE